MPNCITRDDGDVPLPRLQDATMERKLKRYLTTGAVLIFAFGISAAAWFLSRPSDPTATVSSGPTVIVDLPEDLSGRAIQGKGLFDGACSSCHGKNAAGTDSGPPLIHKIYEPGHHADEAFQLAAMRGVRSHHWNFGDMPPVEGITQDDVSFIVTYVRELQRANGIE
ncbi:c-type cytochrome [Bauldia litoralis]|uniref:c-type cytochrome n=2 Tax=Bauldia litoralis TaxID=665467 RepID=UPI0032653C5C